VTDRELDALVAEHVFGLKPGVDFGAFHDHDWKRASDGRIEECDGGEYHSGPQCVRCLYWFCSACARHRMEEDRSTPCEVAPRRYSTTGDGALAVIEQMRGRGFRVELGTSAIGRDSALYLAGFGKGFGFPGHQCESAPRAVAVAALRALGVEVETPAHEAQP